MPSTEDEFFPPQARVVYDHSPLIQVVAQLRFPHILRIEAEPPAQFQEDIRALFPYFERGNVPGLGQIPPDLAQLIGQQAGGVQYIFQTVERDCSLQLTPSSLTLSTNKYARWERFKKHLYPALAALTAIYRPSFFTRVGLRYSNAISREALKLDHPWSQLLRNELLGEMSLPNWEENLVDTRTNVRVLLPGSSTGFFLQHGFARATDKPEQLYLIDFDFYTDKQLEASDAEPTLSRFNRIAGRAFRWCITDTLHDGMGPKPIEPE